MQDLPSKAPAQAIVHFVTQPKSWLAGVVKIPKEKPVDESYENLVCTQQDTACVQEIVTILGENGKFSLLFKQGYLKELGARIEKLHPLKFMTSIFCYPHLNPHMIEIFDDYFKRTGFMDGLGPSLSLEADKGKLNRHLDKFSQEIKVPLDKMQPYFDSQDWYGLVEFLIEYKKQG